MIYPECKDLAKMYITASGQVLPCCYVHAPETKVDKWNINNNSMEFIKEDILKWISELNTDKETPFPTCEYNCALRKPDTVAVHLEITSRCVLFCPRCPRTRHEGRFKVQDLPVDQIKEFIHSSPYPKSSRICFSGSYGDAIYHREFPNIIKYLHSIEQTFRLNTNGSNRTTKWWEDFYDSYDDTNYSHGARNIVIFALDGLADTNEIYRVNSDFNAVFEVMKMGVALGKLIAWQFIPFSHNEHQIEEARKIAKDNGIIFKLRKSDRWNDRYDKVKLVIPDPLRPTRNDLIMYRDINPEDIC